MRSCLKHNPRDYIKNFYQPTAHEKLHRSQSTPSLKRQWQCQECGLDNNSVTWHCLNCECVSFLAPIYKNTLQSSKNRSIDQDHQTKTGGISLTNSNFSSGSIADDVGAIKYTRSMSMNSECSATRKCQLCMYNNSSNSSSRQITQFNKFCVDSSGSSSSNEPICRHQNKSKFLRFPMIGSSKIGPEQKSFDDTKYYPRDSLNNSNRKINKSLSSITDSFGSIGSGGSGSGGGGHYFGECVNVAKTRPNTLIVNDLQIKRSSAKGTTDLIYSRQLSVPSTTAEYSELTVAANTRTNALCNVCGVCSQKRCTATQLDPNETGSRFTVTTLSRNESNKHSKNGGVFVAVRDWYGPARNRTVCYGPLPAQASSTTTTTTTITQETTTESYYEILKNPNNNPTHENQSVAMKDKDKTHLNHQYANQPSPSTQQSEPVYAVVNKLQKSKNKIGNRGDTKFTYIGINPAQQPIATNKYSVKPNAESDALYATIGSNNNSHRMSGGGPSSSSSTSSDSTAIDNGGCNIKTSHITITSSVDKPGSDTSEIFAKVWKGPKKSLDSQKM